MEIDALLFDPAQSGKGEHLKSAGIREDWTVPGHEFMESADFADQFIPGADVQVVGV